MEFVEPEVRLIGKTVLNMPEIKAYLKEIGAEDYDSNAGTDAEYLSEFYGRLCYRSFKEGLNKNVKKIRKDNKKYLAKIILVRHGSVLEHINLNFVFTNVSRVFTHELVRHRIGVGISQESLRYVRLTDLSMYFPKAFADHERSRELRELFIEVATTLETAQEDMARLLDLDNLTMDAKKKLTSSMRRLAPIGLATSIGWTVNIRTLRFVLEQRTSRFAEEEIRFAFGKVASIVMPMYPGFFGDYSGELIDGFYEYTTPSMKV